MRKILFAVTCLPLFLFQGCNNQHSENSVPVKGPPNKEEIRDQFIRANKQLLQKERDEMDYYEKSHRMDFVNTPAGIRYFVYKPSLAGDSITAGMEITMDYTVSLPDGTPCYQSGPGGKTFSVEQDNLESGIHKGLQYLKKGDKALFLIPSHLAHGLLGDFDKIPPQTPIIYQVEIHRTN